MTLHTIIRELFFKPERVRLDLGQLQALQEGFPDEGCRQAYGEKLVETEAHVAELEETVEQVKQYMAHLTSLTLLLT